MADKPKVKVIKKGEKRAAQKPIVNETRSKRAAAREIVANVSGWVSDFQSRKRVATKLAIDNLFNSGPRPSEM